MNGHQMSEIDLPDLKVGYPRRHYPQICFPLEPLQLDKLPTMEEQLQCKPLEAIHQPLIRYRPPVQNIELLDAFRPKLPHRRHVDAVQHQSGSESRPESYFNCS